jgi:GWxTD domain-containing protein
MYVNCGSRVSRWAWMAMIVLLGAAAGFAMPACSIAQSTAPTHTFTPGASGSSTLSGPYLTWLDQDAEWIITPGERSAYRSLESNDQRLQFIQQFWDRRNPQPGSTENKFKEEHYRRLAYANQHFAAGGPGWKSDRGHIYIVYGAPDSIDAHRSGGNGEAQPFEVWHYDAIRERASKDGSESAQNRQGSTLRDVNFKFVDTCHCGDYKLTSSIP